MKKNVRLANEWPHRAERLLRRPTRVDCQITARMTATFA